MNKTPAERPGLQKPMRIKSGLLIVSVQWIVWFILPKVIPEAFMVAVFGGFAGGLLFFTWWLFFSRAQRIERWGGLILTIASLVVTPLLLDTSIATANMGLMFYIYAIPGICLAMAIWHIATLRLSRLPRRVTMIVSILLASGIWIFLRTDGMDGYGRHDLAWRWAETSEQRLLSQSSDKMASLPETDGTDVSEAEWPGFRGPGRDGVIHLASVATDWSASPPVELWRRPVGPGCSSFAIQGHLLYTQEQRGEEETVSCYDLMTGEPVWKHADKARFYDSHAGAGPRATPAVAEGRIFTLGGTGILNALDAKNGTVAWSRDAAADAGMEPLTWGFAGSPLVVDSVVIIALAGKLAAFDSGNGAPLWFGPDGGNSYSSPHLVCIEGISQVLHMSKSGAVSLDPATGELLWEYPWEITDRILQPAKADNGDLILTGELKALRRITVTNQPDGWQVMERWTSDGVKFNFNDFVIHKGHAYGFDGPSLSCFDLETGERIWKGARYRGWLLLFSGQDLLLVLSEKGDLALVEATPDQFKELSRFRAIEGKTWNHPALANDILVVRNAQEMAAFRLPI